MNYLYGKLNKELERIEYSGEDTETIDINIDNENNIIKANVIRTPKTLIINDNISGEKDRFNGAYDVSIEIPRYELEQEEDPIGNMLVYDFKLNGNIISKIQIPYDKDVFDIELDICTEDDNPIEGLKIGDPYLKITIEDGQGSSTYKYISLAGLKYKAGEGIDIENNTISINQDLLQKIDNHINNKDNPHQVTQQQVGIYTYKNINATFEETNESEDYPYSADIELEAIKDDTQIPNIYFSKEQVDSGNYASYCETYYRQSNIGEIINPISIGDNLGGAGFFVNDEQPDFSLLNWSDAQTWENFGFEDSSVIKTDYKSPKYITLISSDSDPKTIVEENTLRVCYFEQEFKAQLSEQYQWYFPADTYAVIMPGYYQFIFYASKESWDPYGNMSIGGYKGTGWGGSFYNSVDKKFAVLAEGTSNVTYIIYNNIGYVDNQQSIWGKWITKDKHFIQTQDEINLKNNESTSIIYLYLPSNVSEVNNLINKLNSMDWDNPDASGTNPVLGEYKYIHFFSIVSSITELYVVYQFEIGNQKAYAIGFENASSFSWVSWGGTPDVALNFDSNVIISNIQHQDIWGQYISNCNRNIKKLSENDIVSKFVFDTSWTWNYNYNMFKNLLDWNNPDETISESDYTIKKIHIFKYGDKYASICNQIDTSSNNTKSYFIQLNKYGWEYKSNFNNGTYSSQSWNNSEYTLDSPVTISEIKYQNIWGSAIGKEVKVKDAGYFLKAYSKTSNKITIPAITLQ